MEAMDSMHSRMKGLAWIKRLLWIGLVVALGSSSALAHEIGRERFMVQFGGVESAVELTYPSRGGGPFPTVILIPGSGVADMDHTVISPFEFGPEGPRRLSAIFKQLAEGLSERGFAVARYNKRHVYGPNQADYARFYQLTLHDFLADAEAVVEAVKAHPLVDAERLFVFGWSEGSTLAAALAAGRRDIAGLVVQGPVVMPWRENFIYQALEVGWPYLLRFAEDGSITGGSITAAFYGDGGMVAKSILSYVIDPMYVATGTIGVNPALDADADGRLRLGSELTLSTLAGMIDAALAPGGYMYLYGPQLALPTVGDRMAELRLPVLILQGARDANVPARGAQILYEALLNLGHEDVALLWYDELGHSLGETPSVAADNFQPIAEKVIDDVAGWLLSRL